MCVTDRIALYGCQDAQEARRPELQSKKGRIMVEKKGKSQLTFVYTPNGNCKKVFVVGTFNEWQPQQGRMMRRKDGSFRKRLQLTPGEYRYKFIVDDQWVIDPQAEALVPNAFGTSDAVVWV